MPTTAWTSFLRARGLPRNDSSGSGRSPTYSRWSTLDFVASATAARMISCCVAVGVLAIGFVRRIDAPPWYAESRAADEVTTDFRLAAALVAAAAPRGADRHRDRLRSRDAIPAVRDHRHDLRGRVRRHACRCSRSGRAIWSRDRAASTATWFAAPPSTSARSSAPTASCAGGACRRASSARAFAYEVSGGDTYLLTNEHVAVWPEVTDVLHRIDGVAEGASASRTSCASCATSATTSSPARSR